MHRWLIFNNEKPLFGATPVNDVAPPRGLLDALSQQRDEMLPPDSVVLTERTKVFTLVVSHGRRRISG